jgi:hypothetical protein
MEVLFYGPAEYTEPKVSLVGSCTQQQTNSSFALLESSRPTDNPTAHRKGSRCPQKRIALPTERSPKAKQGNRKGAPTCFSTFSEKSGVICPKAKRRTSMPGLKGKQVYRPEGHTYMPESSTCMPGPKAKRVYRRGWSSTLFLRFFRKEKAGLHGQLQGESHSV